jgi:hypothetical protein
MASEPKVTIEPLSKFQPQRRNANRHTPRGLGMLETEMQASGFVAPMTAAKDGEVFDGSARLETAFTVFEGQDAIVLEHDGTRPIIMRRTDIPNAQTPEALRISIAANRVAEADLDFDAVTLFEIAKENDGLLDNLFTKGELDKIFKMPDGKEEDEEKDAGSRTIEFKLTYDQFLMVKQAIKDHGGDASAFLVSAAAGYLENGWGVPV